MTETTKTYRCLSVRKMPEGGYVVYQPSEHTAGVNIDLYAGLKLEKCLAFIRHNMEPNCV